MKKTIFKILSLALTLGLLAGLIVGAVPASGLTVTEASAAPSTISAPSTVTIDFTGSLNLEDADAIRVTFPTSFNVSAVDNLSATFDNGVDGATAVTVVEASTNRAAGILTFDVPATGATVGNLWTLAIADIVNPAVNGSYPVTVATTKEVVPQSADITIGAVNKVVVYNVAGQYIGTYDNLSAVTAILDFGYTVEIYAGAYAGPTNDFTINAPKVTVKGMGGAVIIMTPANDFVINGPEATVSDLIVIGEGFVINGDEVTVKNIVFNKTAPPGIPGPETLLYVYGNDDTVMDCSFNLTSPAGISDTGIYIDADDGALVTGCSFAVDQTVAWVPDYGIEIADGDQVEIIENTFTGSSGYGVWTDYYAYNFRIIANTFTGLQVGVWVDDSEEINKIAGNTFTGGTVNGMNFADSAAIYVNDVCCDSLYITDNAIHDNAGYSVYVNDFCCDYDHPFINGNNFSNNAKGIYNGNSSYPLNAVGNYWGDSEGPGIGDADVIDEDSNEVIGIPFISVPNTGSYAYLAWYYDQNLSEWVWEYNSPTIAKDIAGFAVKNYDWDTDFYGLVVGQTLSGNPAPTEPPFPAIAYFDIFMSDPPSSNTQINLYASNLNEASNVYYWSGNMDGWVRCSDQGVSGGGSFAWFKVAPAGTPNLLGNETVPSPDEMMETYFVIVDGIAPPSETIEPSGPEAGAATGLCNVPFSWPTVPGATGYQIVIWTTDMNSPIVEEEVSSPSFMSGCLDAGSYFWKVFAMQGDDVLSESAVNSFVAEAPPTTTTSDPIVITTQDPPIITITQPAETTITIPSPEVTEVTPAWIYVIIGIGAVLVIVVIVLIVRTRRTT